MQDFGPILKGVKSFGRTPKGENNFRFNRFSFCNSKLSAALMAFSAFFTFRSKGRKNGSVIKRGEETFSDTSLGGKDNLGSSIFLESLGKKEPPICDAFKIFHLAQRH